MAIYLQLILLVTLLHQSVCQRPPSAEAARATPLFEEVGAACSPQTSLYSGQSNAVDIKIIEKEVNALESLTNASKWKKQAKRGASATGQIANLFMHSYSVSAKPILDGKVKDIDGKVSAAKTRFQELSKVEKSKYELLKNMKNSKQKAPNLNAEWLRAKSAARQAQLSQRKLSRGLKGLRFASQRLAPALGVFGAVFAIISGFFAEDPTKQAFELLKNEMDKSFEKIGRQMEQKYMELKDYVDDTVQFAQVADLEAELKEMSNYYINCASDPDPQECTRQALRVIIANRFRYTDFKFAPTTNNTRTIKRDELKMDFYRRYVLIFITAHTTALMALEEADAADRKAYADLMGEEIERFKSLIRSKTENIIDLWTKPKTYKDNCLLTAEKYYQQDGKIGWEFVPGDYRWGTCKWKVREKDAQNAEAICSRFANMVKRHTFQIKMQGRAYWGSYRNKLFGAGSVYTRIENMVQNNEIGNQLLEQIKAAVEEESSGDGEVVDSIGNDGEDED